MLASRRLTHFEGFHCTDNVCSSSASSGNFKAPVLNAVYQDCYTVALEWEPPSVPGDKKYELRWAASEKCECRHLADCENELSQFGTIPLEHREIVSEDGHLLTRVVQWDRLDPTNALKTYWFAVKTTTESDVIPPDVFTKVERLHWPSPWNLRVEKMTTEDVTLVWDEPAKKTVLHEVYGVAYEAAKTPGGSAIASGNLNTKSPAITIRWDKMDPSGQAKNFCFLVSSITEKKDIINHSDLLCIKRGRRGLKAEDTQRDPSLKSKRAPFHSTKSTMNLKSQTRSTPPDKKAPSDKSAAAMKHGKLESTKSRLGKRTKNLGLKSPIVKVIEQDDLFISIEWDPPAAPGEKKYELHWAGSLKDEFRTEVLTGFGSLATGEQTKLQISWYTLDSTNKLKTFWFGVKTYTKSTEILPVEFVKVVRKEFPGSWNMREEKKNVIGITLAWDPPSLKEHEFYRVVYGAANRQSGGKGITTGKLEIRSTNFNIPWELLNPCNTADTFCFIVSSMTSDNKTISSSAPFFVTNGPSVEQMVALVTHADANEDEDDGKLNGSPFKKSTEVFYVEEEPIADELKEPDESDHSVIGEKRSGQDGKSKTKCIKDFGNFCFPPAQTTSKKAIRKNKATPLKTNTVEPKEAPRQKSEIPAAPEPLTLRVTQKDYDGVDLEWGVPDGPVEDYTVLYTSCKDAGMCVENLENYGGKTVKSPRIALKWLDMDPTNSSNLFLIGVQANSLNRKPKHGEILQVVREWPENPKSPVVKVAKQDGYTASLEWDPPPLPGAKHYQLQWAACEGPEAEINNVSKTGQISVESPNAVVAWDEMDPTDEMKTFWFAVKTLSDSITLPAGEFTRVLRQDWPCPWNMRVEKINCDGVTIAWDKPAIEDLVGYGVSYTAIEKRGSLSTSGKRMTESPVFSVKWDDMDSSKRADTFGFMVSAMTSTDVLINSDVFRVKRERLVSQEAM